jgi:hypothetical protein
MAQYMVSMDTVEDALTITKLDPFKAGSVAFQFTGTWAGVITFESTVDGTTWVATRVQPIGSGTAVTTATANGIWRMPIIGQVSARARFSTDTSGTVVAYANYVEGNATMDSAS